MTISFQVKGDPVCACSQRALSDHRCRSVSRRIHGNFGDTTEPSRGKLTSPQIRLRKDIAAWPSPLPNRYIGAASIFLLI